ncbi:MAG TPA: extracellular solute-binding protein, partial [Candidatus Binatus sp.]|nr:extracellular solute-binding protein [Candidatus Binatus sp.]
MQQKKSVDVTILWAILILALGMNAASAATVAEVALMKSADRQKILVDGARKESKLVFYTGLIVDQLVRPLKAAFEKEYPFVQMDFFRGNSERVAQRVILEYQAKKYEVDVISGSASTAMVQRAGFMQQFNSPYLADYPAKLKDPKGFWASTNVYFLALGYNARNVRPSDVPKSYEDLLQPRWKGQMLWGTNRDTGAPLFIGNILLTMGQEAGKAYLQKLKAQNITKSSVSARQILDLVIAGESPIALQILNHHAYISKTAGAPVDWQVLEPAPATISSIGLAKNSPHPHAAMLFLDFVLSKKG